MAAPTEAPPASDPGASSEFIRGISPLAAVSLVVGSMIGSGIFIVSADIARQVDRWGPGALLLVWIVLRGRWASNRVMSLLAVYLVLFTATPFIQTRYFYPIFPILYIMAATVRPLGVMGRRVRWKTRTLGA